MFELNSQDPIKREATDQAIWALAATLLSAKGGLAEAFGQAAHQALMAYNQGIAAGTNNQFNRMRIDEMKERRAREGARRELAGRFSQTPQQQALGAPGLAPGPTNERLQMAQQLPGGFDAEGYQRALLAGGDLEGAAQAAGFIPKREPVKVGKDDRLFMPTGGGFREVVGALGDEWETLPTRTPNGQLLQQNKRTKELRAVGSGPSAQVNVNTAQNPFFQGVGQFGAERLRESTQKASEAAARLQSNAQMAEFLSGPNFTGAGAEFKLAVGRALQSVGVNLAPDAVRNTELLATQLAQRTLNNIRSSGLGAGQGFTNADREFLQKAVGGTIEISGPTLQRLLELDNRAARATIEAHNRLIDPVQRAAQMQGFPMDFSVPVPNIPVAPPRDAVEAALRKHLPGARR
jgi:hypothetical protein